MNKKAFTLVELLASIVILVLIAGIGVVAYTSVVRQSEKKIYTTYIDTMHAEAILYLSNNPDKLPANNGTSQISLSALQIDPIHNPEDETDLCLGSYVDVKRVNVNSIESITYTVHLICNDYSDTKTYEN